MLSSLIHTTFHVSEPYATSRFRALSTQQLIARLAHMLSHLHTYNRKWHEIFLIQNEFIVWELLDLKQLFPLLLK